MSEPSALLTDLYQLTMLQGYLAEGKTGRASFEMFFRRAPFGGGFAVCAGLAPLLDDLAGLRFTSPDLEYLRSTGLFQDSFLDYLARFRFRGDVDAVPEGTIVFAGTPLLRAAGRLPEVQLIETLVLNRLNFQTLTATKAARMFLASGRGRIIEFGLRRAPGPDGGLSASRAAYIGGAEATSNVLAGARWSIPVRGTMAHSWVMSFPTEEEAFAAYARSYPDHCLLLIDTYDTLRSGLPHALTVGRRLAAEGRHNFGIRLDSGNIARLARRARAALDRAGLHKAVILASNDLDEHAIARFITRRVPVDAWGVGTRLATGHPDASLTGVYKLTARESDGRLTAVQKITDSRAKATLGGEKQILRLRDEAGTARADLLVPAGRASPPDARFRAFSLHKNKLQWVNMSARVTPLLAPVMKNGEITAAPADPAGARERLLEELRRFAPAVLRIRHPAAYPVLVSAELWKLNDRR